MLGADRVNINIFGGFGFEAFVMNTADGKGSVLVVGRKKGFDKSGFYFIVAINKTNIVTFGELNANITSSRLALVWLVDDFDAGVFLGVLVGDFA